MSIIKSVCVFCGSRKGVDPAFDAAARDFGEIIIDEGCDFVYGGGSIGLMGAIAETVLAGGGKVTGVIPDFLTKYEVGNPGVTELIVVESMHDRKRIMFERSDGFVILPGGIGSLDEMFEIISWKQLQQHSKPVVVLNVNGYWDPFVALIDAVIKDGFGHHKVKELFTVVDRVDEVFPALRSAPEPDKIVLTSHL
ncbi:MAG: TIGR00730 family Rossman fold protein [Rhodospirillales bacterium]|nr:TIGR00730 family Rossman fold protein [Rhodospirillales bacterium]